ncbi:MAG: MBL fold metallo-hydrolase [Candidatus Magasanikbacteria bacterium]|nr:MBL fold metallo-hydrolase [Candidatus Magasanikbacteria bacterium]
MHLSWLGQTALKIQTKHLDQDVLALIDPYRPPSGDFPRSFTPTIALFSRGREGQATLSGTPLVVDTLGEFELKEVMITAFPGEGSGLIFKIVAEGISLVHLGRLAKKIDPAALEKIGAIDILCLPAGNGANYLPLPDAVDLVTALEPRVVIPLAYHSPNDTGAKPLKDWLHELGVQPKLTDQKIIIKKKDLPADEMQVWVLEKT